MMTGGRFGSKVVNAGEDERDGVFFFIYNDESGSRADIKKKNDRHLLLYEKVSEDFVRKGRKSGILVDGRGQEV